MSPSAVTPPTSGLVSTRPTRSSTRNRSSAATTSSWKRPRRAREKGIPKDTHHKHDRRPPRNDASNSGVLGVQKGGNWRRVRGRRSGHYHRRRQPIPCCLALPRFDSRRPSRLLLAKDLEELGGNLGGLTGNGSSRMTAAGLSADSANRQGEM
ncbi:hypothetical protein L209DRAFT_586292 [Thermothelomyces heterothallicus CBS 203.75]